MVEKVRAQLQFHVDPGLEQGVYSNVVDAQSTQWDVILTFYQVTPPPVGVPELKARAVSRVIIPRSLMPSVMRVLSTVEQQATIGPADEDQGEEKS